ncbi:hypothetical protein BDL97_03G072500 [Sphagnum fallax]|nr:hypothetical protein BDL97_03G072500 [Sphagnum fallax]
MELRSGSVVGQEKPTSSSSASSTVVGRLTNEAVAVLGEGIRLCFLRWTALQLAVENEWGGHTSKLKAQQLQSDVLSWFTRSKGPRYIDELENLLDENLVELFNTTADDGSVEEVAEQLMVIHEECTQGNYATVQQLSDAAAKEVSKPAVAQSRQIAWMLIISLNKKVRLWHLHGLEILSSYPRKSMLINKQIPLVWHQEVKLLQI